MKDWARGREGAAPPGWALVFEYAEAFGCDPGEVRTKVTGSWWLRWLEWRKASASHALWLSWRESRGQTHEGDAEKKLRLWAMDKDGY